MTDWDAVIRDLPPPGLPKLNPIGKTKQAEFCYRCAKQVNDPFEHAIWHADQALKQRAQREAQP